MDGWAILKWKDEFVNECENEFELFIERFIEWRM
jgi:hypothetical protein